ncbi:uncharacterized protein LOC115995891 [Ipomoea triloba]|uniref:uncharacterized protein LOC115995891 n=1 Tax=Ipomoea triloba TaxID=35885 RepID=UPI00125CFB6D|nr:uncharacterized protein LOC115995891 [Ipomoea triloba]
MVSDLGPIVLCNVVYKIMAKMVANRMKPLLGDVISDSQSAFIPNRLITDNILIAAEVGHYLNRKQNGVVGWAALKLDMTKAYDRMEWTFLRKMLLALGFSERWVDLVMLCVTTISYNFLVNGENIGQVIPSRGIRQGDPLSPYLFIICTERLSLLLQQAQTHDSLLFFKATSQEAEVIRHCLNAYENMSGQAVNYHKSSVCFSRNTSVACREDVASVLGVIQAPNFGKYLGKKILLKSVAQSMPTFSMSVFLLPDSVCRSIKRAMNRYWWGPSNERGKQAWRFLTRPHSLVARIYKARYFPRFLFIDANLGNCPSFCWRNIMAAHELICNGFRRRIGDGNSTLIWGHPWLPDDPNPMVQTVMPHELNGSLVSGMIDSFSGSWDHSILLDIFTPSNVKRILRVPVSPDYEDSWFWLGDPGGCYTVKQGYKSIVGSFENMPGAFDKWLHLWKIKSPAKWKTFIWRALLNILPTTTNLILKRVDVDPTCPMCGLMHENIMRSLILCDFSRLVWHESSLHVPSVEGSLLHPRNVWRSAQAAVVAWRHTHATNTQSTLNPAQQIPTSTAAVPITVTPHAAGLPSKCYFDASYQSATRRATVGAVLLSHDGVFLAAFNGQLPACFSPLMAESLACKEVLSWLKGRGLASVDVYTDYSNLKQLLTTDNNNLYSYVAFSIDASRELMSSFNHCSVNYVPRTANLGAHTLATSNFLQDNSLYWDSIPPNLISELI